jgi:hypothetical protein
MTIHLRAIYIGEMWPMYGANEMKLVWEIYAQNQFWLQTLNSTSKDSRPVTYMHSKVGVLCRRACSVLLKHVRHITDLQE